MSEPRFKRAQPVADGVNVWIHWDMLYGRYVVLKPPKFGCSEADREAFFLPQLQHPNIVTLLEAFPTQWGPVCVFERAIYDLHEHLSGRLPEGDVKIIARSLFKAVRYIHDRGLIHCDIKPDNILVYTLPVGESGIKLADFGLARSASESPVNRGGTWLYWPPEAWKGWPRGKAGDIWGCGIVLFACLTGGLPYALVEDEAQDREHVENVVTAGQPDLCGMLAGVDISDEAKDFLRAILNPDPMWRPTAEEVLRLGWLGEEGEAWGAEESGFPAEGFCTGPDAIRWPLGCGAPLAPPA
jgi:calcium/calmodulin-dependent protein kinase I